MKPSLLTLAGVLAIALTIPAFAQDNSNNNVMVSPHNYKHPDKAKAAAPSQANIEFRRAKVKDQNIASYREQQRRGGQLESAIAVPASSMASVNRNYKQQNNLVKGKTAKAAPVEVAVKTPVPAPQVETADNTGN
ncbi:hypothetical protein [Tellurirhabdus bombi]|uniref:hypothetical protein n=1 Tax=Tellurirhabdus bombi TaxID=2907205 RepID=UPI001F41D7ED|nr:hypothetical protein [Tellurirhabdus bombi]